MRTLIHNAVLVLPERLVEDGWLLIEDNVIIQVGEKEYPSISYFERAIDADTNFVLPGLIDLHCDAIEKLVEPRPGAFFAVAIALREADWRLAGCGITSEFHAVTLDDNEFGIRSDTFVQELIEAIRAETETLLVRHNIHARLELSSQSGYEVLTRLIEDGAVRMISLMDHSPGQGQYTTEQTYRDYMMRTTNRNEAEVEVILARKRSQLTAMPQRIAHVTGKARAAGLAIATHDDDTAEKVAQWPALGVKVSEFPTTLRAAQMAQELGLFVCMGAPNALRGYSSGGNLNAREVIRQGIANILCSDYYPASMLSAAFKLAEDNVLPLPDAVQLITLNPAKAVGLADTLGSLEVGKVADIIVVARSRQGLPFVQRVLVNGCERIIRVSLTT